MILDAEPDYIATLDSSQLVRLMKRLLLAEARLTGIPLRAARALIAVVMLDEPFTIKLLIVGALMGFGLWIYLKEDHAHEHEPLEHEHATNITSTNMMAR